jgi:hypothetical protein
MVDFGLPLLDVEAAAGVKPNEISESEVRITDISVRSALMRVRWNDMPVRREDNSTEIWSGFDLELTLSMN